MGSPDNQTGKGRKIRILVVEDHPVFIFGLKELIHQEEDLEVCCEASNVTEGWDKILRLKPDMVIVDITLEGPSGIELIRDINKRFKTLPVLVLSMHDESLYAGRAIAAGARGYIRKHETSESIVKAVRTVLAGEIYASKRVIHSILNRFVTHPAGSPVDPADLIDTLSDRELEVLRCLAQGHNTRKIAEKFNLSIKTIGTYRERIKEKLGLQDATELIRFAVRWHERGC